MAKAITAAGRRNTSVVIEHKTETTSTDGQQVREWVPYCTRFARTEPVGGGERVFGQMQTQPESRWVVELPSDTLTRAITPKMRVVVGTRTWNIVRVYDPTQQRQCVWLECAEVEMG